MSLVFHKWIHTAITQVYFRLFNHEAARCQVDWQLAPFLKGFCEETGLHVFVWRKMGEQKNRFPWLWGLPHFFSLEGFCWGKILWLSVDDDGGLHIFPWAPWAPWDPCHCRKPPDVCWRTWQLTNYGHCLWSCHWIPMVMSHCYMEKKG